MYNSGLQPLHNKKIFPYLQKTKQSCVDRKILEVCHNKCCPKLEFNANFLFFTSSMVILNFVFVLPIGYFSFGIFKSWEEVYLAQPSLFLN